MFDWNDEELTNTIWGEAGDSDDHIVPYQDESEDCCNKKEWSQEATTIKPAERKTTGAKIDFNGRKPESISNFNSAERNSTLRFGMDSWSDLSLSSAARTDDEAMGTEFSNKIAEITQCNSASGVKAELGKDHEIFQNSQEGKDQGDFVDYSWDNIGSFDDLERIFSNDDPIFGHVSLGSADGLWSSSKDVTNSPVKSFPLSEDSPILELGTPKNTSERVEVKSEFEQPDDQLLTLSHRKLNNPVHDLQNSMLDHVEYAVGKSKLVEKEQVLQTDLDTGKKGTASNSSLAAKIVVTPDNFAEQGCKQKNLLEGRIKLEDKREGKLLQGSYGTWSLTGNPSGKYENQLAHQMLQASTSPVLGQEKQRPKSETLQFQQISSSYVTPPTYGNLTNPYLSIPVLSHIQSGEFKHQSLSPCYEVPPGKENPVNKSAAPPAKPLTMTPQEKIEKLRRRQQLRAMLAIQKQQQQFSHQDSSIDHSKYQKFQENQILPVEGADLEVGDLGSFPSFDPNSPVEQDDSNTTYLAVDNNPTADAILYHLQDVIAKLDLRVRLCIRDSFCRLAQSAMQRHYASDTSSTNKSSRDEPKDFAKEEIVPSGRFSRMPDAETETNPIDRTVAHLLFHRPLDLPAKHPETPDSPASAKFPCEGETMTLLNLPAECMPESSKLMRNFPRQGPEGPCSMPEPQHLDQFKTSSCIDSSVDA